MNAFEVFAVLVGVSLWGARLSGRRVLVFVDNTAALECLRKARSKAADLEALVHGVWTLLDRFCIAARFQWVPSKLNLGDSPSRGLGAALGTQIPVPPGTPESLAHWALGLLSS